MMKLDIFTCSLKAHALGVDCAEAVLQTTNELVASVDLILELLI